MVRSKTLNQSIAVFGQSGSGKTVYLFGNFRSGLLALKNDVLTDGKPLVEFPRIWVLALSKAALTESSFLGCAVERRNQTG